MTVTERAVQRIISLPMFPELGSEEVREVLFALKERRQ